MENKNIQEQLKIENAETQSSKVNEAEVKAESTPKTKKKESIEEQTTEQTKEEATQNKEEQGGNALKDTKDNKETNKTEAVVNGKNLGISLKHAVAICNLIRDKNIDKAILILEEVTKLKKAVPMKGEIPHRKGKIKSGRYPIKASNNLIQLLKSLRANAIAKSLEIENYVISCKANKAPKVYRRFTRFGSRQFKRTHVELKLVIKQRKKENPK